MKRVLLRGASAATLVVVGGLWASQAMAQAAATPVGTTPGAAAEATGQVIVTATRRNQAIEHVPVIACHDNQPSRFHCGCQQMTQHRNMA